MTLSRIEVRDFQSLRSVDVALGGLTVVVGPSSSGKSALVRALRTLLANGRGSTFVRDGAKVASMTAVLEDGAEVTLSRGASSGEYVLSWPEGPASGDGSDSGRAGTKFTKLGGTVPEQVSAFLGCTPDGVDLRVAGQFDRPFLLDATAGEVGRILGGLTRVGVILDAAREANRRRLAAGATLRLREADLEGCIAAAQGFRALPDQLRACDELEGAVGDAERASARLAALRGCLDTLETAEQALARWEAALEAGAADLTAVTGAIGRAEAALGRVLAYRDTVHDLSRAAAAVREAEGRRAYATELELAAGAELHEVLSSAGECPTCGASTGGRVIEP